MQAARVVGVESSGRRGSGYLIAGRLVLTSARATPAAGREVTIYPAVSGRPFTGVVTWRGTPGAPDDAALVRVDDPAWTAVDLPDPAFGRVATDRPALPGVAGGFPGWNPEPYVETWQVTGTIDAGVAGERFVPALAVPPGAALPGAAVFCRDLLVGVVAGIGDGYLELVPAGVLCRAPGFLDAAGRAVPGLRPVELADAQLTEPDQLRSPTALLRAGAQVAGFRGRHRLMDELDDWCGGAGFAARLLHGPAGQGKSRIGYELTAERTADGWATLWLDETAPAVTVAAVADVTVPLLIVVDGAENRPEQVRTLLEACARHDGRQPLRVLLLARTAGDWWQLLQTDRLGEQLLDGASVLALPELDDDAPGRIEAYRQAVHDLAAALPRVPGYATHDWRSAAARLTGEPRDVGGQALAVQTAALADLLDALWPGPAATGKTAADRVLAHERRYWSFTAAWHGLTLDEPVLQDVLAVALLFGPVDTDQADRLLSGIAALSGHSRDAVRGWLSDLYPGGTGRPWGGLRPDPFAERFAGQRLAAFPGLVTPLVPVVSAGERRRMLTGFARAAQQPDLTDRLSVPLTALCVRHADLLTQPAVEVATSVAAPGPLVTALRKISADPDVTVERLARIGNALPRRGDELARWAVEITQRIADQHRTAGRAPELATALTNLSVRLGDLGSNEPALAAIEEAVMVHGRLAGEQPETYESDLARSLSNLSVRLGVLDQLEPSLAANEEAIALYRQLAGEQPDTFQPALAKALRQLALSLGALERYPQALAAIEEAVLLYRRLAAQRPDEFRADLAASLSILGINLGSLDLDDESRSAAAESVTIRRQLAALRPDAFQPGLATALTDLAVRHVVLGEREPALAAIEESLTLRHRLVAQDPETYGPDLEWSLHVHGVIQGS
ncbi:tetratricopeptide repeat protein [Actinoplanes awajinensis]|uniref:Tetratricopeptide repeat protein n=1 Tax=Actinoplanes awajinensis subsp. mycoplanecinus TaxID=135947 RepID=A0A0X3UYS4_9ACTN|nr:tetratricopeptide repeat protein [Actinoplanes awajinensis]KUL37665.1 hypothetical protein ADL15_11655 [Actinoplanes awajinensis subsp. mycoplanecinus]